MFKLIARTVFALFAVAAVANAAPSTQIGHVTFVDEASGQILVDNQIVALSGDPTGVRLGDEVAFLTDDEVVALVEPTTTGAIAAPGALPEDLSMDAAAGIITCANPETGIIVLDNSLVLTADPTALASLRLGQMAQARYSEVAGVNLASSIATIE